MWPLIDFEESFNQTFLNNNLTGTRPALSMSHPVCYSAAVVMGTNIIASPLDSHHQQQQHNANNNFMVNGQRILEGQLVTPGAEHLSLPTSSSPSPSSSSSSSASSSNGSSSSQQQQHPNQQEPTLSPEEFFTKLHEALSLEPKFQPSLYLPQESQVSHFYYLWIFSSLIILSNLNSLRNFFSFRLMKQN